METLNLIYYNEVAMLLHSQLIFFTNLVCSSVSTNPKLMGSNTHRFLTILTFLRIFEMHFMVRYHAHRQF